jgi:hypothetical protein
LIADFTVHFQLMTVPGQVFYEASRKSVLRGTDGLAFVADSQIPLLDANLECFDGLRRNCLQHDIDLNRIPLVFQYNKRDLPYLIPVETFNNLLNPRKCPWVEAVAINGVGVFETLREISKLTVPVVRERVFGPSVREGPGETGLPDQDFDRFKDGPPSGADELDFIPPERAATIQVTKVHLKSTRDIEDELEKLSKEFIEKEK